MVMQQLVDGKKANPKMQSISNIPYAKNVILGSVKLRKVRELLKSLSIVWRLF